MRVNLLSGGDSSILIILGLLGIFGVIVIGVILMRKYLKPFQSDEKPKDEKEAAAESVDRLLEDVDDEATAKAISSYKQENIIKDDEGGEDKPILK